MAKIIDLFSGVGGLSLGAARAGFTVLGAIDNDTHAIKAHGLNFPNCKHWQTDISSVKGKDLVRYFNIKTDRLEGIIGGPPCQGFSSIGHKNDKDPRNELYVHFYRLVGEIRPKFFLSENVPGILNEKHNPIISRALSYVKNYSIIGPLKLKASDYGVPTSRKRVFFFGYLPEFFKEINSSDFNPPDNLAKVYVREALKGLPHKINPAWQEEEKGWRKIRTSVNGNFGHRLYGFIPAGVGNAESIERLNKELRVSGCLGTYHSPRVLKRYSETDPGKQDRISKSRRLEANGFCHTLRAGTGSDYGSYQAVRPLHPTENRVITPREAARLQGFPDWFRFDSTKWHSFRQIGNSVSPILAEYLLKIICDAMRFKE